MATDMVWPPGVTRWRNGDAAATASITGIRREESAKPRSSEMPGPSATAADPWPNNSRVFISHASFFDGVDQVGAAFLAGLGLHGPAIAERVAHLDGVDGFGQGDAVAHVQARRQVLAQHQRGTDGALAHAAVVVGLDADVGNAELRAELRGEQRRRLPRDFLRGLAVIDAALVLRGLQRTAGQDQRDDLRLRNRGLGEEREARFAQRAAYVHAGFHVGEDLDGAD